LLQKILGDETLPKNLKEFNKNLNELVKLKEE